MGYHLLVMDEAWLQPSNAKFITLLQAVKCYPYLQQTWAQS